MPGARDGGELRWGLIVQSAVWAMLGKPGQGVLTSGWAAWAASDAEEVLQVDWRAGLVGARGRP